MGTVELITDDGPCWPWLAAAAGESMPVAVHLVLAWYPDEPARVGQSAPVIEASCFGRHHARTDGLPLLVFLEQRPGSMRVMPPLMAPSLSRRQLELTPLDPSRVRVQNVGRRALFCNGVPVVECTVGSGDTLLIDGTAVLLVEERPLALPVCSRCPSPSSFSFGAADPFGMVGESPTAWALRAELASAAAADDHLLLLGESGAGKEVAAAVVHGLSARRDGPLVARNAATMPETLLDAELFGSARNYPNMGSPERRGVIGEAHGGHLLLDEIGEMPAGHQAHLLRVLDTQGQYHRLGEAKARVSDFRLIAATNRDPGALKHDLLARFPRRVVVPRLGERPSDVPLLVRALVERMHARTPERLRPFLDDDDPSRLHLDPRLMCALLRHPYTWHVRELHRLLELSLATSRGAALELTPAVAAEMAAARRELDSDPGVEPANSPPSQRSSPPRSCPTENPPAFAALEREPRLSAAQVTEALEATSGNVTQAAVGLGVSRYALRRLIRRFGLVRRFGSGG